MKKTLLILSMIALILAGCKKFDEIEASKVEIVEEIIERNDRITFNVTYSYPVVLEAVEVYIADNVNMNNAKSYFCNVEGKKFSVSIDNVNFEKIYYCYEYDNGYEKERCGVGVFTKSMCCYYGHEYVDLGLPSGLKWATCNVGATSPEEYGDYYAWGETTTKSEYTEENCPTYGLSISELQSQGYTDGEGKLTAQYDAATANWGGDWRMPTRAELSELLNNCTWTSTTQNGISGYNVEGPNGNSIFLPAAGFRDGSSLGGAGSYGFYWSSMPNESNSRYAYYLSFNRVSRNMGYYSRGYGRSVRPVFE